MHNVPKKQFKKYSSIEVFPISIGKMQVHFQEIYFHLQGRNNFLYILGTFPADVFRLIFGLVVLPAQVERTRSQQLEREGGEGDTVGVQLEGVFHVGWVVKP